MANTSEPNLKHQDTRRKGKATLSLAAPSGNPFIVTTAQNIKPDADMKRLIRRHVRKGKGLGKRPTRVALQRPPLASWINQAHHHLHQLLSAPQRHLPTLGLEIAVKPYMVQPICDFIQAMTQSLHPIELCVDRDMEKRNWLTDVSQDAAYANIIWYVSMAYFAIATSPTSSRDAAMYMNKTITLVRERLAQDSLATSDSTLFSVLALAMASDGLGNPDMVKLHLGGLAQLINLRGGMAALAQKHSLQIKSCRFDLRYSIQYGSKPLLFADDSLSWKQYLVGTGKSMLPSMTPFHELCENPDIRIVNVWLDLTKFTVDVNLAHQTRRKLSSRLVQEALISIQYRLQHLVYDTEIKLETIRITMLAFSMTLMIEMNGIPSSYPHLTGQLRKHLQSLWQQDIPEENGNTGWLRMILWLTFVGRLSTLQGIDDYRWLGAQMLNTGRALRLDSWPDARKILKSFLWVDIVHDDAGRRFFQDTMIKDI